MAAPLLARFEQRETHGEVIPLEHQDGLWRVMREFAWLAVLVADVLVEKEDLHVLGAVGEHFDVHLGVAACGAVEHGAGQVGAERFEQFEDISGGTAHGIQALFVLFILIDGLIFA